MYKLLAYRHVEEEQQFVRLRQRWIFQCQQQYDEFRGIERRSLRLLGAQSDLDLTRGTGEADQAEKSDRESENERRLVRLLSVDYGTGYPRI